MSLAAATLRSNTAPRALASRRARRVGNRAATSIARAKSPTTAITRPPGRAIPVEARLSGFSTGPRVSNSRDSSPILVAKTLLDVREGDLLALTVTPATAGATSRAADELKQMYVTVTKISLHRRSPPARRRIHGPASSSSTRARAFRARARRRRPRRRARRHLDPPPDGRAARLQAPELGAASCHPSSARGSSRPRTPRARRRDQPETLTTGATAPIEDPSSPTRWRRRRGRGTAACSRAKTSPWRNRGRMVGADAQPIEHPWAAEMVRRCAESDEIGVEMSESDDVEANPGLTAVFYRASAGGAAAAKRWRR